MTITLFSLMSTIMTPSLCKRIAYENIFANHSRLGDISCAEFYKSRGFSLVLPMAKWSGGRLLVSTPQSDLCSIR
jgi:hypothetical protein